MFAVDWEMLYDRVPWAYLWAVLWEYLSTHSMLIYTEWKGCVSILSVSLLSVWMSDKTRLHLVPSPVCGIHGQTIDQSQPESALFYIGLWWWRETKALSKVLSFLLIFIPNIGHMAASLIAPFSYSHPVIFDVNKTSRGRKGALICWVSYGYLFQL